MKSVGIVSEFNPFHEGHGFLVDKIRESFPEDVIISVMSGNFVQRGGPAFFDKWKRAEDAIIGGVNLVIELPIVFSCSSSSYFAGGAVSILEKLGVDVIGFGSEAGDKRELGYLADILKSNKKELHEEITNLIKTGCSYPKARDSALKRYLSDGELNVLREPNNLLAVEYIMAKSTMDIFTVKRWGKGHIKSATEIRSILRNEYPHKIKNIEEKYFQLLTSKVLQSDVEYLSSIAGGDTGLGNKLKSSIRYVNNERELIEILKSKAYTRTRISRFLTQVLVGIKEEDFLCKPAYARILGLDKKGREFIKYKKSKEENKIPFLTNINKIPNGDEQIFKNLRKDILASDLYNLIVGNDLYEMSDFVKCPYILQ